MECLKPVLILIPRPAFFQVSAEVFGQRLTSYSANWLDNEMFTDQSAGDKVSSDLEVSVNEHLWVRQRSGDPYLEL